jgi:putative transposase
MAGTYTKLYYHIVFSTKNRQRFIDETIDDELHKYICGIIRGFGGQAIEVNGTADHIHILAIIPPTISISDALRTIKANSSKWVHETTPALAAFAWQDGYSTFTVSASQVEPVRQYIRDQKSHHSERDFKSELLALLQKHGVDYGRAAPLGLIALSPLRGLSSDTARSPGVYTPGYVISPLRG